MPVTALFKFISKGSRAKMRAFFHWGQRHKLLVPPSMVSVLRKDISEVHCLGCWGLSSALLVWWTHISQHQVLQRHCQCACSLPAIPGPCCLWQILWRLQTQQPETLALFVNIADIIIEGKQIVCNPEYIVLPYTILRKAFLLIRVWRGFPGFETVGEIFKPFRHSNKQT